MKDIEEATARKIKESEAKQKRHAETSPEVRKKIICGQKKQPKTSGDNINANRKHEVASNNDVLTE